MTAFDMGGYGMYVWGCFGLTLLAVFLSDWYARVRHRRVFKEIEVRIKALEGEP